MSVFRPGDLIRIKSGPFASFVSEVVEVDAMRETLRAQVAIFGRLTPVKVAFSDAEPAPTDTEPDWPRTSLN